MRILLVEDDEVLLSVLSRSLADAGHRVDAARNLPDARHIWRVQLFDAVLLDLNLPLSSDPDSGVGNGLTALREARARGDQTPVLILSARNWMDERIAGLDAGADDYLGKPFDLAEVEARLRAMVRRSQKTDDRVQVGQLVLDRRLQVFQVGNDRLDLPGREFEVLCELMTQPGNVVSKRMLSDKLSDIGASIADNAIEAFVYRLRRKIAGSGASIRTLRGLGYLLEASGHVGSGAGLGPGAATAAGKRAKHYTLRHA